MADAFTKARLRSIEYLMRDQSRTPCARLVGWYLYFRMNRVSHDAWPAQQRIASEMGIDIRTVRRSLKELSEAGYITVVHGKRHNRYKPDLQRVNKDQCIEPQGGTASHTGHTCTETAAKMPAIERMIPDKTAPLTLSSKQTHSSEPFMRATKEIKESHGLQNNKIVNMHNSTYGTKLKDQRGDERAEAEAIRLLSRDGSDGFEILSKLHEIDSGQPRLRLLRAIRYGTVTEQDLRAARLIVFKYSNYR